MNITEKVLRQKQDFDDVYEAGKKSEYDAFWDEFQDYGNRTTYVNGIAGYGWNSKNLKPKYDIKPTLANYMFANIVNNIDIADVFEKAGIIFDTSKCKQFVNFANSATGIIKFPPIDFTATTTAMDMTNVFSACSNLKTLHIIVASNTMYSGVFSTCRKIENITVEGTIGQNGFDIHWSTNLTADSLKSIVNALSTTTTGLTITLPTTAEANYNANPPENAPATWAELVTTRNNWTIAYA